MQKKKTYRFNKLSKSQKDALSPPAKSISIYIIIKLLITKDKENNLKSGQGKMMPPVTGTMIQMTVAVMS